MLIAQYRRALQAKSSVIGRTLTALFSDQVEKQWASYLDGLADRVTVARAILAEPTFRGTKLDVWRTISPQLSAPIWLSSEEVTAVLTHLRFTTMDHLGYGAGWRSADELPAHSSCRRSCPGSSRRSSEGT
ncbi:hypothetical protein GCM10025867_24690 [Frondihabitans sucicola]|uniref:DUF4158 domain-containing protein n=1 Tax=Frondihabitans sucicola TaxID=1268041 RepID=A0ABM8GP56_9MICO|nr:hypothetical protein GCM10025867_24690 [Frondihabitans sucicola]